MLSCFKAYDVRGRVPETLNPRIAYAIGMAFVSVCKSVRVVVGRDCRLSSDALSAALIQGLRKGGAEVVNIGLCGTEEMYYATFAHRFDGGIMVTGSHNPATDNGMKFVRSDAQPMSGDSGLKHIHDQVCLFLRQKDLPYEFPDRPDCFETSYRAEYVDALLRYTDRDALIPLHIHADPGNGCAGLVLNMLAPRLPYVFSFENMNPDGQFPNGVPNPLLPERRATTTRAVQEHRADLGLAWDGDFDRCFFYDAEGKFIEGYYIVGLLAQSLLLQSPKAHIVHDPRLYWNTQDLVLHGGGVPVRSKTGHAFMKEHMRATNALYGGEMSAHHYFRDFAYCDSGMIPWLLVAELLCRTKKSLAELVAARQRAFPCSGEINRTVTEPQRLLEQIHQKYAPKALRIDTTDGLSIEFESWRFNVRMSNTEPLLRLNVESRADQTLMEEKTAELLHFIEIFTE